MSKKNSRRIVCVGEPGPGNLGKARSGTTRYLVVCDALQNGEPVELHHPWRAMTPEEAIALVKADNRKGLDAIINCRAEAIQGSFEK